MPEFMGSSEETPEQSADRLKAKQDLLDMAAAQAPEEAKVTASGVHSLDMPQTDAEVSEQQRAEQEAQAAGAKADAEDAAAAAQAKPPVYNIET